MDNKATLFEPLELPCGLVLKNRIAKSAMSDSLGDGTGHPTPAQNRLYRIWAEGGLALAIIGEVQGSSAFAEKPGNLVLTEAADLSRFADLAKQGSVNNAQLWIQLGHAGALAYPPTSKPIGPSALDLPDLKCAALSVDEIRNLPAEFARTSHLAQQAGFGGVQVHAAHGFLLSQFLSPLFNLRDDEYGGSIENRMRLLLEVIDAIRSAVGPKFPISVKLNSSDQLDGGFDRRDALSVIEALDSSSVDLIDISGGTYFPGAKAASDGSGRGPYFLEFAEQARKMTSKPLMLTGGFKKREQAENAIASGVVDMVGLARAHVLHPDLANLWKMDQMPEPVFPKFSETIEGGVTAWYTMQLTKIGGDEDASPTDDLIEALSEYEVRDRVRTEIWLRHFAEQT